jgi:peptidoglycan/LPS O-acetylase OafA/YrhL
VTPSASTAQPSLPAAVDAIAAAGGETRAPAAELSPAVAPPRRHPRFPLADSVRALAALAIIGTHTAPALGRVPEDLRSELASAVQVFFALSGFLLFRPFIAADALGLPRPRITDFFRRRLLRIVPAYWVALTVTGLVLGADVFTHRWWLYYGFIQVYSLSHNFGGIPAAWSLSVEMSFYLMLPLVAWIASRLGRRLGWQAGALITVSALYVLGLTIRTLDTIDLGSLRLDRAIERVAYGLPGQAQFFAAGMFLAILSVDAAQRGPSRDGSSLLRRPDLSWGMAGGIFLVVALVFGLDRPLTVPLIGSLDFRTRFLVHDALVSVMVLLILLPAVFDGGRGLPRLVLGWRPLLYIGVISYGIYIWHLPMWLWVFHHAYKPWVLPHLHSRTLQWAICLTFVTTGAIILGALSYRFVELPFLRRKPQIQLEPSPIASPAAAE